MGFNEELALKILLPLIQGTLQNVKEFKLEPSLTGPIIRGDQKSIKRHLEALRSDPPCFEIYRKSAIQALEIAKRKKKLTPQQINAMKSLLEEK